LNSLVGNEEYFGSLESERPVDHEKVRPGATKWHKKSSHKITRVKLFILSMSLTWVHRVVDAYILHDTSD
jgi:hypothetical protein